MEGHEEEVSLSRRVKDDDFGFGHVKFEKFLGHSCRNVQ